MKPMNCLTVHRLGTEDQNIGNVRSWVSSKRGKGIHNEVYSFFDSFYIGVELFFYQPFLMTLYRDQNTQLPSWVSLVDLLSREGLHRSSKSILIFHRHHRCIWSRIFRLTLWSTRGRALLGSSFIVQNVIVIPYGATTWPRSHRNPTVAIYFQYFHQTSMKPFNRG